MVMAARVVSSRRTASGKAAHCSGVRANPWFAAAGGTIDGTTRAAGRKASAASGGTRLEHRTVDPEVAGSSPVVLVLVLARFA